MLDERPIPKQDEKGRFVPGNNGGTGRPKGSRNKFTEALYDDFLADWEQNGAAAIAACLDKDPVQYVKIAASLISKEINLRVGELDELTDDQLARQLASIAAQLTAAGFDLSTGDRPAAAAGTAH